MRKIRIKNSIQLDKDWDIGIQIPLLVRWHLCIETAPNDHGFKWWCDAQLAPGHCLNECDLPFMSSILWIMYFLQSYSCTKSNIDFPSHMLPYPGMIWWSSAAKTDILVHYQCVGAEIVDIVIWICLFCLSPKYRDQFQNVAFTTIQFQLSTCNPGL